MNLLFIIEKIGLHVGKQVKKKKHLSVLMKT